LGPAGKVLMMGKEGIRKWSGYIRSADRR
jgi:hypothetical protein